MFVFAVTPVVEDASVFAEELAPSDLVFEHPIDVFTYISSQHVCD